MQTDTFMENIIEVIKEGQIKLGYQKEAVRLFYPLESMNAILKTTMDCEDMKKHLDVYFEKQRDIFGMVDVSYNLNQRFCIFLPEQASEYIHENTSEDDFLYGFIHTMEKHDVTIEQILECFYQYSEEVHFEKINNQDFDYLIYFETGKPNSYRYCITDEGCHMIYHRFSKIDYEQLYGIHG